MPDFEGKCHHLLLCRVFVGNEEWVQQQVGSCLHERQASHSSASTSTDLHRFGQTAFGRNCSESCLLL